MSRFQDLKDLFKRRLQTAAREHLIGPLETKISGYEKQIDQQQKLLDVVLKADKKLHRETDVQQLFEVKEEVPSEQQEWSSSLDQEDPEPPHIKEEQEELWSSQEGEQQLQGLQEADITKFTLTPVPVKSEDDEEKPQSSQLHQTQTEHMETEAAGEDCGGPEPDRNSHPDAGDSVDSDFWKETRERPPGLNEDVHVEKCKIDKRPFGCSECGKRFGVKGCLKRHMISHTGEKPFSCSVCAKRFISRQHLKIHTRTHTGEKPFSCSVCSKSFIHKANLTQHTAVHTGEKRFSCSVCHKRFAWCRQVKRHKCVQSSQLPQRHTEADGEDCGGPEPDRNSDPDPHLQRDTEDQTGDSSDSETDDSDDWKETTEPQSGLKSVFN